jgi:hypothetical protein
MNKYFIFIVLFLAFSAESKDFDSIADDCEYLIAGQSNASRTDWSYFEGKYNVRTCNIAIGGYGIHGLIREFKYDERFKKTKAVIFVHGENDSNKGTRAWDYAKQVRLYRQRIGDIPFYISLVGYRANTDHDKKYNVIRSAQKNLCFNYVGFICAFDDAKKFREWGYLGGNDIHFNFDGQKLMMDSIGYKIFGY